MDANGLTIQQQQLSQELQSRSGEGGAKTTPSLWHLPKEHIWSNYARWCGKPDPLWALLTREQASNCQIEEANQEVVTQNDLLSVYYSLIRKKFTHIIEQSETYRASPPACSNLIIS